MTLKIHVLFNKVYLLKVLVMFLLFLLITGCTRNKRYLVVSKIKSTAELATTKTIIDKVIVGTKQKSLVGLIRISNSEFVAYSQATVKTGIDLNKIRKDDIKIKGSLIELELPPIEIINFSYPFTSFRIDSFLSDNDFLSRIDVIDQENFYRQAELDIRENLKYMGIVEQTRENTQKLMEGLLKNLGYKEIYITFRDSALSKKEKLRLNLY